MNYFLWSGDNVTGRTGVWSSRLWRLGKEKSVWRSPYVEVEGLSLGLPDQLRGSFISPCCFRNPKAPEQHVWPFLLMMLLPRHPQTSESGIRERDQEDRVPVLPAIVLLLGYDCFQPLFFH